MCGFAGFVHPDPEYPVHLSQLLAMRDSLTHRGPDDAGHYVGAGVALGSRRLAILDLSERGRMPMATADGRFRIAYNGEVYNYRELRPALEGRGINFASNTDTEVLLQLFATEGPAMLSRLNGMFAFAIWDAQERTLVLARDRVGVKPVYYALHNGVLYFASEEKALFAAGVPAEFDLSAWEELLSFRYVAGEQTPFLGVKRLLPGHYLTWKDGQIGITRWWNLGERARTLRDAVAADPARWFQETFDSAISLRRISDVPIGVMLSGGLDSSSVAAGLALQAGPGVCSFTMRFPDLGQDEWPLAKEVAGKYQLTAHELAIAPKELLERLRSASWFNDEPLAHASDIHVNAISAYAKNRVTVLLSGEGSDETLGGYVRYRPLQQAALLAMGRPFAAFLQPFVRNNHRLNKLCRFLQLGSVDDFILYNASEVLPADLAQLGMTPSRKFEYRQAIIREGREVYPGEPMRQAMYLDQHTFLCSLLDRNDRMTMGASIECRVPFLDYRLVEGLAAMPTSKLLEGNGSKPMLRKGLGSRLPNSVLEGKKWGFGVPWSEYCRKIEALRSLIEDLPEQPLISESPIDLDKLRNVIRAFFKGENRYAPLLVELMMLVIWHDVYFRRVRRQSTETPAK